MEPNRATAADPPATRPSIRGTQTDPGSRRAHGDPVRAPQRHSVEHAAPADGVWVRHHVLAATRALATGGRVEAAPPRAARRVAPARPAGPGASDCRQCLAPRAARGKKTGPNPTDRRKAGSKHHVLTDANGIPVVARLTSANRHDITQLVPLVAATP